MIAIIDYGMGNIHSVRKALEVCGAEVAVTNAPDIICAAAAVVLPGVGAFDDAMLELEKRGLVVIIKEFIAGGKPFLGICLGMQLLFDSSEEAAQSRGLGVLAGRVVRFQSSPGLKVPHMGWNQIRRAQPASGDCPLMAGIPDNSFVYFCHSYYPRPADHSVTAAVTEYGADFACAVWRDSVFGVQFHPEKSQTAGLKMIQNFVALQGRISNPPL